MLPKLVVFSVTAGFMPTSRGWSHFRLAAFGFVALLLLAGVWALAAPIDVGDVLTPPLEQRFRRIDLGNAAGITGVIALGGGDERIQEACRQAQIHPHLKVFVSGAGEEAEVRRALAPDQRDCRLQLENFSRNTRGNAAFTSAALRPAPTERWLLITSASHMPRAIGAFRKAGVPVEPWPVYHPKSKILSGSSTARHEWLGLLAYWLMGHSSELFPAPPEPAAASIGAADQAPAFAPI